MRRINNLDKPLEWIFKYVQWEIKGEDFIKVSDEFHNKITTDQRCYILCPNTLSGAYKLGALILSEEEKQLILQAVRLIMLITSEIKPEATFTQRLHHCKQYFNWDYSLTSNDFGFNSHYSGNFKNTGRYN